MNLEAILLVGGMGVRLRPLTVTTPKPMLPVAGVPFLAHQIARLAVAGVDHVVLATSYRPEVFTDHFGDGSALGVRLEYAVEDRPLGTAGAIRNAAERLDAKPDDAVVVGNGDILDGHSVSAQAAAHEAASADVTLYLTEVDDPRRYGCVPVDDRGYVTQFLEKTPDPVTNLVNAGCYVFRRSVLEEIPAGRAVSVERETFPALLAEGRRVLGHVEDAYWLDIGTPEAYVRGSADVVLGNVDSPARPGPAGEFLVLPGAIVEDGAVLSGGTAVSAGAVVSSGARVDGSVILDGARIESDAVIVRSAIGAGAVIRSGAVVRDAVVGEHADVGSGNELRNGIRIWSSAVIPDTTIRFSPPG